MKSYPSLVVHALIKKDGKFLAIRRGLERSIEIGKWECPGGRVDFNEKLTDAVMREVKEETGLQVKILRFLGWGESLNTPSKYTPPVHRFVMYFECDLVGGEEKFDSYEINEAKWVTIEEFKRMEGLSEAIKDFFRKGFV